MLRVAIPILQNVLVVSIHKAIVRVQELDVVIPKPKRDSEKMAPALIVLTCSCKPTSRGPVVAMMKRARLGAKELAASISASISSGASELDGAVTPLIFVFRFLH